MANVLISGVSGMIGQALNAHLSSKGFSVFELSRSDYNSPFHYNSELQKVHLDESIPLDVVINLAGPSLADGRWSAKRKRYLKQSRVELTSALSEALATTVSKPKLFLSASAIGFYGLTGDQEVTEESQAGSDFLAEVASSWESATLAAEHAEINTIHMRFGVVLSPKGGMVKQLLLPFKLGLGGRIGDGCQYLSWISLDDVLHIIDFLIEAKPRIKSLNLVSNHAVTNSEFTEQFAKALNRPSIFPMPAFAAKLLFGEMADALLLGSSRVKSAKLCDLGIDLKHSSLQDALEELLNS